MRWDVSPGSRAPRPRIMPIVAPTTSPALQRAFYACRRFVLLPTSGAARPAGGRSRARGLVRGSGRRAGTGHERARGRNAVRSHTRVPKRAFPLGRDAVLRRPSRGHREHPPPGAPPACRPQAPTGQPDRGPGRRRAGLRAQAQSHRHAGAEATCVCSPGCRPGASRRGSRAGTTAGRAFLEEIDNAQGRDAAPVTRGTPVRARSPAGSRRQSEPEAF